MGRASSTPPSTGTRSSWPTPGARPSSGRSSRATLADAAPTNELWRQMRDGQGQPPGLTVKTTERAGGAVPVLPLAPAFPQVFAKGGFDVVLGNPPWERVKLQEQEFFASLRPEIATRSNGRQRKRSLRRLRTSDPDALARVDREPSVCGRREPACRARPAAIPLRRRGDMNTYALFAELNRSIWPRSRAGWDASCQTGIATDDTTKDFFAASR